jgi:hypothetical protein
MRAKPAAPPCPRPVKVASRWVEIAQFDRTAEGGRNRSHLGGDDGAEFGVRKIVELLATCNAGLQHSGVVEGFPDTLLRDGQTVLATEFHVQAPAR